MTLIQSKVPLVTFEDKTDIWKHRHGTPKWVILPFPNHLVNMYFSQLQNSPITSSHHQMHIPKLFYLGLNAVSTGPTCLASCTNKKEHLVLLPHSRRQQICIRNSHSPENMFQVSFSVLHILSSFVGSSSCICMFTHNNTTITTKDTLTNLVSGILCFQILHIVKGIQ